MHRIRFDDDSRMEERIFTQVVFSHCYVLCITVIPEGTTTIEYPKSKRRVVKDHKGNIMSDLADKK
jgi:hypothetical protein